MLVAMKKRLAPTDRARKFEITRKYRKLKTFPKHEDIERWLRDWETTFTEATKLSIEVEKERLLFDFTYAIAAIDSVYVSTQEPHLNLKVKNDETLPSLYDIIKDFHNHRRRTRASNRLRLFIRPSQHSEYSSVEKNTTSRTATASVLPQDLQGGRKILRSSRN